MMLFCLLRSPFVYFRDVLKFALHRFCKFLVQFIPKYFILYFAIGNGTFSNIISSNGL